MYFTKAAVVAIQLATLIILLGVAIKGQEKGTQRDPQSWYKKLSISALRRSLMNKNTHGTKRRNGEVDCSEKAIRIYKFCIDGDHEEDYPNEGAFGEYKFFIDGKDYYPAEDNDCFRRSKGSFTDPGTPGYCSWESNQCHEFVYEVSKKEGWISFESHRSLDISLNEKDHQIGKKDDQASVLLSPSEWYDGEVCDTYEVKVAKEFESEKVHTVCWSLAAGVDIKAVSADAGVTKCTSWTQPAESWTWLLEVTPISEVTDERDTLDDRNKNAGCFSGNDTVMTKQSQAVPIQDIKVGDEILTMNYEGAMSYSPVVFIPHVKNEEETTFVTLRTQDGKEISTTTMHLLRTCNDELVKASSLKKSDCLFTVDGHDKIVSVSYKKGRGIYTVVTKNDFLIVGGVVASPFAIFHWPLHLYYHLHRFLYWISPKIVSSNSFVMTTNSLMENFALCLMNEY